MAAPTSRTVCLRAFNEDLIASNQFRSKTPPPPIPMRIAWPGGKIVSNKDEALANFLRRKLDQGQTLTPEQMTMLEKMVEPNGSETAGATCAFAPGSKRVLNGSGGVVTAEARVSVAKARSLLKKLDDKLAHASNPENSMARGSSPTSAPRQKRRTVDLSSIKSRSAGKPSNTVQQSTTKSAAAAVGGSKARRVLPNGQGGFSIETAPPLNAAGAGPCRPKEGNKRPVTSISREINRLDKRGLNSGAVANLKGRDKVKRKAFVPNGGRGRGGKKAKKIPSNASAATASGKRGNVGGGSCAVRGAGSKSLDELMTGGLAARR